jgi:trehalose 6-phosphate phosphatase
MSMQSNAAPRQPQITLPWSEPVDLAHFALLLDIDGTLLDIAATPDGVIVPPSLLATLAELHHRTDGALALVSGRRIDNIDRLFYPLKLPAIGGHGAESRLAIGDDIQPNGFAAPDQTLKNEIMALAGHDPNLIYEDKVTSVALHYRRAPEQESFIRTHLAAIMAREPPGELDAIWGKFVVEVKPMLYNKGSAVAELMTQPPFADRTPLFIGDDTTDLSVFKVLQQLGGRGFSVGAQMAGAIGTFDTPLEVRNWLAHLCRGDGPDRK